MATASSQFSLNPWQFLGSLHATSDSNLSSASGLASVRDTMARRLEIELTSERPDGTWTWRAAGAKHPKGDLSASILPDGSGVGDVLRVEAEFHIDGIEITEVLPAKAPRKEPERLEILGSGKKLEGVTTQLHSKGKGGGKRRRRDDDGEDRGERRDRRDRSDRPSGERRGPRPNPVPERPKPKRLRPGRKHRNAVLEELPVEHRPIAEEVLRGGIPAVRAAIAQQNEQAKAENRPEIQSDELIALAEKLLPRLRAAEWRDRADDALAKIDDLDLRDLRSVIVAADGAARDDESRAIRDQIQAGLTRRVEEEQQLWVNEIAANLDANRFIRALRLSSRSPKAGAQMPAELAIRLIEAASEGLNERLNQDLWANAADALASSPLRDRIIPASRPANPSPELLEAVTRAAGRASVLVELFGLDPQAVAAAAKNRSRTPYRGKRPNKKQRDNQKDAKGEKSSVNGEAESSVAEEPATGESTAPATPEDTNPQAAVEVEGVAADEATVERTSDAPVDDTSAPAEAEDTTAEDATAEDGDAAASAPAED